MSLLRRARAFSALSSRMRNQLPVIWAVESPANVAPALTGSECEKLAVVAVRRACCEARARLTDPAAVAGLGVLEVDRPHVHPDPCEQCAYSSATAGERSDLGPAFAAVRANRSDE